MSRNKFDELAKGPVELVARRQGLRPGSGFGVQTLPGLARREHPDRSASGGGEVSSVASDQRSLVGLAGNLEERQIVQIRWHFVRPGVGNYGRVLVFQFRQESFAALWRDGEVGPRQHFSVFGLDAVV